MYPRQPDDPFRPTGAYLLDISTAKPVGDIKFPSKPIGEGHTSSDYLQRVRENDPWPEPPPETPAVVLSSLRIETPPQNRAWGAPLDVLVDVSFQDKPNTAQVDFHLFCATSKHPEPKTNRTNQAFGYIQKVDGKWQAKARLLLDAPFDTVPGEVAEFQVSASHPESGAPLWSDTFKITCKALVAWISEQNLTFEEGSAFPRLGQDGALVHTLHLVVDHWNAKDPAEPDSPVRLPLVVLGFAPDAKVESAAQTLSSHRALALYALLARDPKAWQKLATDHAFRSTDLQRFLSDLQRAFGWQCGTGEFDGMVGESLSRALRHFEAELGRHTKQLARVDSSATPQTWDAVFQALLHLIDTQRGKAKGQELAPPWLVGEVGVVALGSQARGKMEEAQCRGAHIALVRLGRLPQKSNEFLKTYTDPSLVERHALRPATGLLKQVKTKTLQLGLFFDGTGNNREHDEPKGCLTNIAKLYDLYPDKEDEEAKWIAYYVEGIGTTGYGQDLQQAFGKGFAERVVKALKWISKQTQENPGSPLVLRLFGFSRGAASARATINALHDPKIRAMYDLLGANIQIELLGIFDTVGSVGIPGNDIDFVFDLTVRKGRIKKVIHLIAQNEVRSKFDLWSIRLPLDGDKSVKAAPEGWAFIKEMAGFPDPTWEEWIMPGMHADVGGGYRAVDTVPEFDALPPHPGEQINAYVYRVMDERIKRGDSNRGFSGCEEETQEQFMERLKEWRKLYPLRKTMERPDLDQFQYPPPSEDPKLRNLNNDLSRIPLWVMIERCREAGMEWKRPTQFDPDRWQDLYAPFKQNHPLNQLQNLTKSPETIEKNLTTSNHVFCQHIVTFMHDSRWIEDVHDRTREVYFGGRKA